MRRWVHNLTGVSISLLLFYLSGLSLEPCTAMLVLLIVNSLRTVAKPYSYFRHNKLRKGFDWLLRLMGEDVLLAAMALLVCNLNPTGFLPEAFTCLAFLTTGTSDRGFQTSTWPAGTALITGSYTITSSPC